jgi:hypothetical protein
MNCVGIDIHKKYRVLCAQDEQGRKIKEALASPFQDCKLLPPLFSVASYSIFPGTLPLARVKFR